jgi:hypothetical protein
MDRFHVESVAEDESDPLFATQVGDPIPAEQALDGDRQVLSIGSEGLQQLLSVTRQLSVDEGLSFLVEDAEIEATGVEVDTAVMNMLFRVESQSRPPFFGFPPTAYRSGRLEGASNQYPRDAADA